MSDVPDESPLIGRKLGRFRIESKLGRGGMATVWKARDELLGRTVALKVLDGSFDGSAKTLRRFVHDAQAAALLEHPSIVTVFDAGESDGQTYIALTYVDGDTVSELAARELMPLEEAVRIAVRAAEALEHAHARGVLHRDVTGRNIMVAKDGRVFVLDFSLAYSVGMTRLTSSDAALGTVAYMAPEALLGKAKDHDEIVRCDIYGLGVVLFEALTGTLPFMGERKEVLASAKLNTDPGPPSEIRPDVPGELDRIVLRAIAREPAHRYDRVAAMLADLRSVHEAMRAGSSVAAGAAVARPAVGTPLLVPAPPLADPAQRAQAAYLAIPPFEVQGPGDDAARDLARRLPECLGAALASEVRVVPVVESAYVHHEAAAMPGPELARRLRANTLLRGTVRQDGTRVRVTFSVRDLWQDVQLGGAVVDGSVHQIFDLEDDVVASLRKSLGLGDRGAGEATASRGVDPAAEDHYALALTQLERHDDEASLDAAIRLLERLEASDPKQSKYPATLARAYLRKQTLTGSRGWEAKAAAACDRAQRVDPAAFETRLASAELASAAGHSEAAVHAFQELAHQRPESAEPWLGAARALLTRGSYDEAEDACAEAIHRSPGDWRGHSRLGLVRYRRGDFQGALSAWRTVVELVPDSLHGRMNLTSALQQLGRLEEALGECGEILKRRPNAEAYWNTGTILFFLGREAEAIEVLERAVALGPERPLSWGNLGNVCRQVSGHERRAHEALERAVALATEALERDPSEAELRARLAGWLTGLGRNAAARIEIDRALKDAPDDVQILEIAGHVHLLLGDRAAAVGWLKAAVARGYDVEELRRSRELAVLTDDPEFRALLSAQGKAAVRPAG